MKKLALAASLALAFCASAQAAVLTTTFANNNGQNGNMFDVVTKGSALTVTGFDLNLSFGQHTLALYKLNGSWTGAQYDASAWTLLDTVSLAGNGGGNATFFDVADFNLNAGATTGLYITITNGGGMNYTDGSGVGNVYAEDNYLQILEGAGKAYAFSTTFTPRIWNGSIYYQVPPPTCRNRVRWPCSASAWPASACCAAASRLERQEMKNRRRERRFSFHQGLQHSGA